MWRLLIFSHNQIHWLPYHDPYLYMNAMLLNTGIFFVAVSVYDLRKDYIPIQKQTFLVFFIEKEKNNTRST